MAARAHQRPRSRAPGAGGAAGLRIAGLAAAGLGPVTLAPGGRDRPDVLLDMISSLLIDGPGPGLSWRTPGPGLLTAS